MKSCLSKHTGYYLSLVAILFFGFFLFLQSSYDKNLQILIMYLTGVFYAGWGIIHHLVHHDLNLKIVIEYVLIGSLGVTIMWFFLKG